MDGPLKSALDRLDSQGVIMRELVTYKMKNGLIVRETVRREYNVDGDYTDHSITTPFRKGSSV
jgi:hypothetical protein